MTPEQKETEMKTMKDLMNMEPYVLLKKAEQEIAKLKEDLEAMKAALLTSFETNEFLMEALKKRNEQDALREQEIASLKAQLAEVRRQDVEFMECCEKMIEHNNICGPRGEENAVGVGYARDKFKEIRGMGDES